MLASALLILAFSCNCPAQELIFVGDSITAANSIQSRVINCLAPTGCGVVPSTPKFFSRTFATSSYTLADMAVFDAPIAANYIPGTDQTIILWGGTNDVQAGADSLTIMTRLEDRVAAYRAAGYTRIVAITVIAFNGGGAPEAVRLSYNISLIAGASGSTWTAADVGGTAGLSVWSGTYYSDSVHPNAAGYDVAAPVIAAAVQALHP